MTGLGCCARAVSGHAITAPPTSMMNSRRRIYSPSEPALCNAKSLAICDRPASKKWHSTTFKCGPANGRGRDEDFSSPPAQIPACAANAPGSSLGSDLVR